MILASCSPQLLSTIVVLTSHMLFFGSATLGGERGAHLSNRAHRELGHAVAPPACTTTKVYLGFLAEPGYRPKLWEPSTLQATPEKAVNNAYMLGRR